MSEERANYITGNEPEIKLLPCPFCGGRAELVQRRYMDVWMVRCPLANDCQAWPMVYGNSVEEAVAAWNTRKGANQ